jgi:hypothetical protein
MSEFPAISYLPSQATDEIGVGPEASSLEVMQAIYRNPTRPFARRMRAAQAA